MTTYFSAEDRTSRLEEMSKQDHDILVIGGGITGSGIALDASSRGMKTALVEMQDFAAGTSSRSTKLVHGGLRYLKQFEVKMVAEVGKERAIVYENGPHVTTPEWMLLPIYKEGTFGKLSTSVGLRVYDYLANVKRNERRKMLDQQVTKKTEPLLKQDGLLGGGVYVEYRTDDARLTIEVLKKAVDQGASAVNYAKVDKFIYQNNKVVGVVVIDQLTNQSYKIFANKIVNASGPWVDTLREKDNSKKGKSLHLTKGIHLVFDQKKFPLKQAIYFDTPDGRMVFAIPRDGKTYVGTTDTVYSDDIIHPRMTLKDKEYVINAINYMFPSVDITKDDIESSWAGLRPLIHEDGKSPSEISRKDEVWTSESGLITIAGGKLTGYRKMAEMVVDLIATQFKNEGIKIFNASTTKTIKISGGDFGGSENFPEFIRKKTLEGMKVGLTKEQAERLVKMYGSNIDILFEYANNYEQKGKNAGLALDVFMQLLYTMKQEMTVRPTDFFIRRTGALFFNIDWVYEWKEAVVMQMANILEWSQDEVKDNMKELDKHLHDAVTAIDEEQEINQYIS
ncbi:glycerol-3-phosphate dehydrogenase/oxidase [Halalkalibacter kiskunsagensis]|uniref:Glycerol-3-phosphate dehydrogenase n=1 Tax=Halalkalibacter kiskunsagensis TaxID=1548599 RepID=A0ABV6KI29_9BACI